MDDEELKVWYKVGHANGRTFAKVTLVQGNVSTGWSEKTYASTIPEGMRKAYATAHRVLAEMKATIAELEKEEANG